MPSDAFLVLCMGSARGLLAAHKARDGCHLPGRSTLIACVCPYFIIIPTRKQTSRQKATNQEASKKDEKGEVPRELTGSDNLRRGQRDCLHKAKGRLTGNFRPCKEVYARLSCASSSALVIPGLIATRTCPRRGKQA